MQLGSTWWTPHSASIQILGGANKIVPERSLEYAHDRACKILHLVPGWILYSLVDSVDGFVFRVSIAPIDSSHGLEMESKLRRTASPRLFQSHEGGVEPCAEIVTTKRCRMGQSDVFETGPSTLTILHCFRVEYLWCTRQILPLFIRHPWHPALKLSPPRSSYAINQEP